MSDRVSGRRDMDNDVTKIVEVTSSPVGEKALVTKRPHTKPKGDWTSVEPIGGPSAKGVT